MEESVASKLLEARLKLLEEKSALSRRELDEFGKLERTRLSGGGEALAAFHEGDRYRRLLERVLEALVDAGEPGAREKYKMFLEERGTMGPAVFLTPWELTLHDLDVRAGGTKKLLDFYRLS